MVQIQLVESKIVVEFTLEEREALAQYLLHDMQQAIYDSDGQVIYLMEIETYDILKALGRTLAPDWC